MVHAPPQELMKSLQCQQLELECITSLGEEILSTCHPDSVITIKSWVTVVKSRFQEVSWVLLLHPSPGTEQICTHAWDEHGPTPFPLLVPLWRSPPDRRVAGNWGCSAPSLANTDILVLPVTGWPWLSSSCTDLALREPPGHTALASPGHPLAPTPALPSWGHAGGHWGLSSPSWMVVTRSTHVRWEMPCSPGRESPESSVPGIPIPDPAPTVAQRLPGIMGLQARALPALPERV